MIFYLPDPLAMMPAEEAGPQRTYRMPSGGIVYAELLNDKEIRITSVCSTDPMDYMHPLLSPGSILKLGEPQFS